MTIKSVFPRRLFPIRSFRSFRSFRLFHAHSFLRRSSFFLPLLTLSSVFFLSSCAALTHYNNKEKIDGNRAVFVDAKQRAFYSSKKTIKKADNTKETIMRYCAEPSPDGLSALATTLGFDLSIPSEGKLNFANTLAESVANIGVRTAGIQALRDMMYRNCEAYINGGMSDIGLETLQRRFQTTMMAILAVEQLTGAIKAPPVVISQNASAGSAEAIVSLTETRNKAQAALLEAKKAEEKAAEALKPAADNLEKAKKALTDFEAEIKTIEGKADADRSEEEKAKLAKKDETTATLKKDVEEKEAAHKPLKEAHDAAKEQHEYADQAFKVAEDSLVAAKKAGAKTTASVQVPEQVAPEIEAAKIDRIATAVENIIGSVAQAQYGVEVCTTVIGDNANQDVAKNSVLEICKLLLLANAAGKSPEVLFDEVAEKAGYQFDGDDF